MINENENEFADVLTVYFIPTKICDHNFSGLRVESSGPATNRQKTCDAVMKNHEMQAHDFAHATSP